MGGTKGGVVKWVLCESCRRRTEKTVVSFREESLGGSLHGIERFSMDVIGLSGERERELKT